MTLATVLTGHNGAYPNSPSLREGRTACRGGPLMIETIGEPETGSNLNGRAGRVSVWLHCSWRCQPLHPHLADARLSRKRESEVYWCVQARQPTVLPFATPHQQNPPACGRVQATNPISRIDVSHGFATRTVAAKTPGLTANATRHSGIAPLRPQNPRRWASCCLPNAFPRGGTRQPARKR